MAGLLALVLPFAALAQTPVPVQTDWVDARQSGTLANGQALSFVKMGAADGLPLILLHGFTDTSRSGALPAPHQTDAGLGPDMFWQQPAEGGALITGFLTQ